MPTTDSIVRPSLLLKKTLVAGQKANVDSVGKAGQNTDSSVLLRPKKQKRFQLTDFKFAEEGYSKVTSTLSWDVETFMLMVCRVFLLHTQ